MELNYNIKAELDTSNNAEEPVWSDLGKTMTNLTMSLSLIHILSLLYRTTVGDGAVPASMAPRSKGGNRIG